MAWSIEFDEEAIDELARLDREAQRRIIRYLRERIATDEDPRRFGRPLKGELAGLWRYRAGDYRIVCEIQEAAVRVVVVRVGHRRDVYR